MAVAGDQHAQLGRGGGHAASRRVRVSPQRW
jgi:hypothetical protein